MLKKLGAGSFGTCLLVERKDNGQKYALKQISGFNKPDERKAVISEIELHKKMKHASIVRFRQAFIEEGKINIVMDFCDGGDLHDAIKKQKGTLFEEARIMDWLVQLLSAVGHMHDLRVLHRDIKPQNVFLKDGTKHIQLGDFGISRTLMGTNENAKTVPSTSPTHSTKVVPVCRWSAPPTT